MGRNPQNEANHSGVHVLLGTLTILVLATIVRIWGASGDLWLDEVLSIEATQKIKNPWEVFTKIHEDNNHYINSIWLYWVASSGSVLACRAVSLLAGAATVILAGLIGLRCNRVNAVFSVWIAAFSYVLILYSSEARGYSLAMCCAFAAFYLQSCYIERKRWYLAVAISFALILGLLAHLSFVCIILTLLVWLLLIGIREHWRVGEIVQRAVLCYALPSVVVLVLYLVDIRELEVNGGSTSLSLMQGYRTALAWILGTLNSWMAVSIVCYFALFILGVGVGMLWREKDDSAMFYPLAILIFPLVQAGFSPAAIYYVRYFIVGGIFVLLLFSWLLADLYRRGGSWRVVSLIALIGYTGLNGVNIGDLLRHGRGQNKEALSYIAENTDGQNVSISGNHDYRIRPMVEYYGSGGGLQGKTVTYYPNDAWPAGGVNWIVVQIESNEKPLPPWQSFPDTHGNRFVIMKTFQSAPLSGLHWFVYRRNE